VDGAAETIEEVLADPQFAPLLSNEGVMRQARYEGTDLIPAIEAAAGAKLEAIEFAAGVRVVIDRPETDSGKPVLLIFYALPNGGTIEQTIGKAIKPGDDWHFDTYRWTFRRVFQRHFGVTAMLDDLTGRLRERSDSELVHCLS
jgi:hypothetical protein